MQHDGLRVLQPLSDAAEWLGCFDVVQLNEDEMRQLSPDPLGLAAEAMAAGISLLVVTLGPRGAAYVAAPGFDGWGEREPGRRDWRPRCARRSSRRCAVDALDPTGCGDVFGAAAAARLFAGDGVEAAIAHANAMAGRNAAFRGAGGLAATSAASWWRREPGGRGTRPARRPELDQFAAGFGSWPPEEKLLIDARAAQWASPYGLIGMLTAGQALAEAKRDKPLFTVPRATR